MKSLLSVVLILVLALTTNAQTASDKILGEWLSPKKDGRILIYKSDNKFFGKIIWGTGGPETDENNPDPSLRKRPMIGLEILKDFVFDDGEWVDGTIYDPREGKTYNCKLTLDSHNKLNIRGFVGLSLFGRAETWTRFVAKTK